MSEYSNRPGYLAKTLPEEQVRPVAQRVILLRHRQKDMLGLSEIPYVWLALKVKSIQKVNLCCHCMGNNAYFIVYLLFSASLVRDYIF